VLTFSVALISRLHAPERDYRLEQIEPRSGQTFDWVFNDRSVGLSKWLQGGEGVFWISGKPGSGKSTLMKCILNDSRTDELRHSWTSKATTLTAKFFFHHRGTTIQKSLEGLLGSILSQILEHKPELHRNLYPVFDSRFDQLAKTNNLDLNPSLIGDLTTAWKHWNLNLTPEVENRIKLIATCQNPRAALQSMKTTFLDTFPQLSYERVQPELLNLFTRLSQISSRSIKENASNDPNNKISGIEKYLRENMDEIPGLKNYLDDSRASLSNNLLLDNFIIFIIRWISSTNLEEQIHSLLEDYGGGPEGKKGIVNLIEQQKKRVILRSQVQEDPWSMVTLKHGLRQILNQEREELDIWLFLDALDEYDGQPDVISKFVLDLTKRQSSQTRIRVCFSSRPWDAFVERFGDVPGFKIHEHTGDDITNYCVDTIEAGHNYSSELLHLVPTITSRAQGVFLWVKLVLRDLIREASDGATREQLKRTLSSFPDDLYAYYTRIVERILPSSRWATYCALELVSRSQEGLSMRSLLEAVNCSSSQNYPDGKNRLLRFRNKCATWSSNHFESQLQVHSGGLLDLVASDDGPSVQFMHQTVQEFVERPQFKQIVLGDRSKEIHENGHSFLTKYNLLLPDPAQAAYYARAAEQTTGRSLSVFISSISFKSLLSPSPSDPYPFFLYKAVQPSALIFATYSKLQLYLMDELQTKSSLFSTSKEPLLSCLVASLVNDHLNCCEDDIMPTMNTIINNGYRLSSDRHVFGHLIAVLWTVKPLDSMHRTRASWVVSLIKILLDHGLNPNMLMELPRTDGSVGKFRPLHVCTPDMAELLLAKGTDVNALDDLGFGPLDSIFLKAAPHFVRRSTEDSYKHAILLIKHGGTLHKTPISKWDVFAETVAASGLDSSRLKGAYAEQSKNHQFKSISLKRFLKLFAKKD
jgi:hypothetical protein